jgi:hypothetical protein
MYRPTADEAERTTAERYASAGASRMATESGLLDRIPGADQDLGI